MAGKTARRHRAAPCVRMGHEIVNTGPAGNSPTEPSPFLKEDLTMLQLAIACLVIALIAALLGFGGIAGSFVGVAKILFVVFLVVALLSFVGHGFRSRSF
jgi:uncharacterized membrane protein YtjA (UPF0391 family)